MLHNYENWGVFIDSDEMKYKITIADPTCRLHTTPDIGCRRCRMDMYDAKSALSHHPPSTDLMYDTTDYNK